jgi:thioredoxin 2
MASAPNPVRCTNCGKLNRVPVGGTGTPRCANCKTTLPWIVDADGATWDEALDSSKLVLVDFWADWCQPCRMVSPVLEKLAGEFAGKLKLVKLDTEAAPDVAGRFQVQGIPLMILFRDGEEIDRRVGARPESDLRPWLEQHLAAAPA